MTEAIIALAATIFGGAGVKFIDKMFSRREARFAANSEQNLLTQQDAITIRQELRTESTSLREEMKEMRDEVDRWRQQYFKLLRKYNEIELKYETLLTEMSIIRELLRNNQDPNYIIRSLETRLDLLDTRARDDLDFLNDDSKEN